MNIFLAFMLTIAWATVIKLHAGVKVVLQGV